MPVVCCQSKKGAEQTVRVDEGRSSRIRVKASDGSRGELVLSVSGGAVTYSIEGPVTALLNDSPKNDGSLGPGDLLEVGGNRFRLDTQNPAAAWTCSSCGGSFQAQPAWHDGEHRICTTCWDRGVRPQQLPGWMRNLEVDIEDPGAASDELKPDTFTEGSGAIQPVGDAFDHFETEAIRKPAPSAPLAQDPSRSRTSTAGHEPETEPFQSQEPETEEARRSPSRSSRRLSASRVSTVDEGPSASGRKKGILSKVSKVFTRKGEDSRRLDQLINERQVMLEAAGRLALECQGGFGLPLEVLTHLGEGKGVNLSPGSIDRRALTTFRERAQQLTYLDAEITELRQRLGMPEDDASYAQPLTALPQERRAAEARAFQASDGMMTEQLPDVDGPPPVPAPPPVAPASGNGVSGRRSLGRRRRR